MWKSQSLSLLSSLYINGVFQLRENWKRLYAIITFYNLSILNIEKYLTDTVKIENVPTPVEKRKLNTCN